MSKFIPLIGRLISLPAGISRMNIKKFVIYTFIGSLPLAFVLGYLGFKLGQNWYVIKEYFNTLDLMVIVIDIIGIFVYVYIKKGIYIKR
ncbi:MAG: DedA family protein [Methanobacterium sp.]